MQAEGQGFDPPILHERQVGAMSHCANYVLVLDGQQRIANSRWGSKSLLTSLAFGPESALEFLLEATTDIEEEDRFVYGELMCEGAVFASFDERRLLVFGGEDVRGEKPLQRAYVALLGLAWPGWEVQWAYGGWQDVARASGLDVLPEDPGPARALDRLEPLVPYQKYWGPAPDGTYAWFHDADAWHRPIDAERLYFNRSTRFTCVTVRAEDGAVRHYQVAAHCNDVFATGPALLPLLASIPEASFTPASNGADGGLSIDEVQRRVRYWVSYDAKSWLADLVSGAWRDWDVARDDRALAGQLELVGHDSRAVAIPLRLLGEVVLREIGDNSSISALVDEIRRRASQPNVVVAPGATRLPAGSAPVTASRAEFLARLVLQLED